jgi:lipoprotein signal peptidase
MKTVVIILNIILVLGTIIWLTHNSGSIKTRDVTVEESTNPNIKYLPSKAVEFSFPQKNPVWILCVLSGIFYLITILILSQKKYL